MTNSILRVCALSVVFAFAASAANAQAWPEVFNPFQILTLNLQLSDQDWDDSIRYH